MSNASTIEDLIPLLPPKIRGEIRDKCLQSRARDILAMCDALIREDIDIYTSIYQLPNLEFSWHTPVYFNHPNTWKSVFYIYIWYLFNTYHMPLLFDPKYYKCWGGLWFDYTLFDKFWFQVFGEDWRVVASGQSVLHPLLKPIDKTVILIVKLNSRGEESVNNCTELEWVTNSDGSFHRHLYWESIYNTTCQTTIWRAHTLNTGDPHNLEDIASTPDAYRIQDLM